MVKIGDIEYKVVVISLEDSKRRENLKERLAVGGIEEFEIVDAQEVHYSNIDYIEALTDGKKWTVDPRLKNQTKNASRMACYLSHISLVLYEYDEPILVLEDDITFKSDLRELPPIPEEAYIGFLDGTHIEHIKDHQFGMDYSCGWKKIDVSNFRVWCLGAYICPNPKQAHEMLIRQQPKVVDKLFIDCFQKNAKSYVYLPIVARQDRRSFKSTIA